MHHLGCALQLAQLLVHKSGVTSSGRRWKCHLCRCHHRILGRWLSQPALNRPRLRIHYHHSGLSWRQHRPRHSHTLGEHCGCSLIGHALSGLKHQRCDLRDSAGDEYNETHICISSAPQLRVQDHHNIPLSIQRWYRDFNLDFRHVWHPVHRRPEPDGDINCDKHHRPVAVLHLHLEQPQRQHPFQCPQTA